eukprot:5795278-Ditylum_brightwellii.AAC.1
MRYNSTTAFGIAELVNFFGPIAALYGIGQGATDRPHGWALISSSILKVYHKLSKGCTITDSTKTMTVNCKADMFVDDATM